MQLSIDTKEKRSHYRSTIKKNPRKIWVQIISFAITSHELFGSLFNQFDLSFFIYKTKLIISILTLSGAARISIYQT